jgi:hypothetical protein
LIEGAGAEAAKTIESVLKMDDKNDVAQRRRELACIEFEIAMPPCSRHVRIGRLRASSPNMPWHLIGLAAAELGSRPSASPNQPLS